MGSNRPANGSSLQAQLFSGRQKSDRLVWAYVRYGRRNPTVAVALAIGVLSHVMLDIIHHEPDIALLPIAGSPRIGFGLATKPVVDLAVELVYGLTCWFLFRGSRALFAVIVAFN